MAGAGRGADRSFSEPDDLLRLVTFKHTVGDVDFPALREAIADWLERLLGG